jgi:hypothetical protein
MTPRPHPFAARSRYFLTHFSHPGHPLRSPLGRALPPPLPSTTTSGRRPSTPENHHCVEHLLKPPSSERSLKATIHFFTICCRERLLMADLLRPFSDPAIASLSSAGQPWCLPTPPGAQLATRHPPHSRSPSVTVRHHGQPPMVSPRLPSALK